MHIISEDSPVQQKIRDLCQAIVDHPEFGEILQRNLSFQADSALQQQLQQLNETMAQLQEKQQQGQPLTESEMAAFEQLRSDFLKQPLATAYVEAQQEVQAVRKVVGQYVSRTFELGRMPQKEDLASCGHGCECH